jgi:hypothetical protein
MGYKARLQRLEAPQRRTGPVSHFVPAVFSPSHLHEAGEARWLRDEVICACGRRGCPELQVGVLLPEKAPSDEAEQTEGNGHDG